MKNRPQKFFALVLSLVLIAAVVPGVAAEADSIELYSWEASAFDKDRKAFSSNLVNHANAEIRWNASGVIYGEGGKKDVAVHSFFNAVAGRGSKTYGLPQDDRGGAAENLKVVTYPSVVTDGLKAVGLSMTYAYVPASGAQNAATDGLLRVYVSENGVNWSEDSVPLRSVRVLGGGKTSREDQVIFYQLQTENLMDIDSLVSGDSLHGVCIMPDGQDGVAKGQFALCDLTLTGYKSVAAFRNAVPAVHDEQSAAADTALYRQAMVDAAVNSAAKTELGVVQDALSLLMSVELTNEADLLNTAGLRVMDGVATRANDRVHMIFDWMYDSIELEDYYTYGPTKLTKEQGDAILAEYEKVTTTKDIVIDLNTPQQMMRAYAAAKPGDMLLQMTESGNHAYVVLRSNPVYLPDEVSLDPNKSTMTYLTLKGEKTTDFFHMFATECFVPVTVSALADGTLRTANVDVQAAFADGASITVVSSLNINRCEIALAEHNAVLEPGVTGLVYTGKELDSAVAALADGKHVLTVKVFSGPGDPIVKNIEVQVKDGKATAVAAAAEHSAACPSKSMTDVDKSAWYHTAVDYALTNGIMGGYNATTFGPNDTLSRAMVVQVLYNKEGQPAISGKHDFADVPADQWFNNAVTWGTRKGVMGGYGNGKFGPNDSVTIEQIAVILWNYAGNPAFSGKADSVGNHSGWAANALSWAVENNILEGVPFTNATENATRAQTAQMLMNYLTAN